MSELVNKWNDVAKTFLKDRKIIDASYATDQEMSDMSILSRPLVLTLDNGTSIVVMCDDEGNDAGSLHLHTKAGKYEVLPTL